MTDFEYPSNYHNLFFGGSIFQDYNENDLLQKLEFPILEMIPDEPDEQYEHYPKNIPQIVEIKKEPDEKELVTTHNFRKRKIDIEEDINSSKKLVKEKKEKKRIINNRKSAHKSRMKRKQYIEYLEKENQELDRLSRENDLQVTALKAEQIVLKQQLDAISQIVDMMRQNPKYEEIYQSIFS